MIAVLCAVALAQVYAPGPERFTVCEEVAAIAAAEGVPMQIALSVALVESGFTDAVSRADARGPMQVMEFLCPGKTFKGCDLVRTGVRHLRTLRVKYGTWTLAWCHYSAGGQCTKRGREYAAKVFLRRNRLRAMLLPWGHVTDDGLRPPRRLK